MKMPMKIKLKKVWGPAACLVLVILLFQQTAFEVFSIWIGKGGYFQGLVLFIIAVYLIIRKRREIFLAAGPGWGPSMGIAAGALVLFVFSSFAVAYYIQRISTVIFIYGALGYLYGKNMLHALFWPAALLLMAIPLPALVVNEFTMPMKLMAARISAEFLCLVDIPVFLSGNILEIPGRTLEVADACSGSRSLFCLLILAWLLSSGHGSTFRKAVFICTAVPLAVWMNVVRITSTGFIMHNYGDIWVFHDAFGWIAFVLTLAFLVGAKPFILKKAREK